MRFPTRLLLAVALLLSITRAWAVDITDTVDIGRKFGPQTCPVCIGDPWDELFPGDYFMFNIQSHFEDGACSACDTTVTVEFPEDAVIPHTDVYDADYVTVVDNMVLIHRPHAGGIGINVPFELKGEQDLAPGITEITMKTHITVSTPSNGVLQNMVEDTIPVVRQNAFTASASASPSSVKLSDANATITVTVTFQNVGGNALTHVAPADDPAPSVAGVLEKASGPTPASVDLAAGGSGSLTYTYTPKKAGKVTLAFSDFLAEGSSGVVHAGPASTNEIVVKDQIGVEVRVTPSALPTDSSTASAANVVVKAVDPQGQPVAGQAVALDFPQYFGIIDQDPRVWICKADGTQVFPPGASPTLLDVDYATTSGSGEVSYRLQLGTQRRTQQLLVTAAAIDENRIDLDQEGVQVDLPQTAAAPNPSSAVDLNALQLGDLPEAQRGAAASVIASGAPLEVLRALSAWLETKREAGAAAVMGFDWVPIATQDEQYAGALLYDRAQLEAVRAHFDGGGPVPNAYVLQIEKVPLGIVSYEVKWERPWMALDTWENTPLDNEGLPVAGSNDTPRLRAKPMTQLATGSQYAFLGYPYPAISADGYGAGCVPKMNGVSVQVHSPVTLLVKDAQGRRLGFDETGAYVNEIPGAAYGGGEPTTYTLPAGSYQTDIVGTGKGVATIVLSAAGAPAKTFVLKVKPKKTGTLTFDDGLGAPSGTFNKKKLKSTDGVPITVTGVKKKIKVHSGDPLALTVTSVLGNAVSGARVHAVGTGFDAEALTGPDGVVSIPLVVTKDTKKLTVTVDGAGVQTKTLKVKLKLAK